MVPGTGVEPVRPRGPADFTYHHSFRYHASPACFVVWTIPLPYAVRHLGRGRLVSTLSHAEHGLSSGSPSARPVKGSPNLTPVHPRVSPWGTPASPLRLPVPPPGRVRSRQHRQASRECKRLDGRTAAPANVRTREVTAQCRAESRTRTVDRWCGAGSGGPSGLRDGVGMPGGGG